MGLSGFTEVPATPFMGFIDDLVMKRMPYNEGAVATFPAGASSFVDAGVFSPLNKSVNGYIHSMYVNDFYYRIHVTPNPMTIGNLLSEQNRDLAVWNSYFVGKSLSTIDAVGDDGLILTEPAATPLLFQPLEEKIYSLAVKTTGPPTIAATYTFNFPAESVLVPVTGSRVVIFPFSIDWGNPIKETLKYDTDVIESHSGQEQRVQHLDDPQRSISFDIIKKDNERAFLLTVLKDWQARVFGVPLWQYSSKTTAAITASDLTVYLSTDKLDFAAGGLAIIYASLTNFEVIEIDTLTSSSLTLAFTTAKSWPVNTHVIPIRLGRLQPSIAMGHTLTDLGAMSLDFKLIDNEAITEQDSTTIYRTLEVFEEQPREESPSTTLERKINTVDFGALMFVDDISGRNTIIRDFSHSMIDIDSVWVFRQWLHARKGKLKPFWVPTWDEDFKVISDSDGGSATLSVQLTGYVLHGAGGDNTQDVRIELTDGTVFYRRILSATDQTTHENLLLDSVLGQNVAVDEFKIISFLSVCRLNADSVSLNWVMPDFVKSKMRFRSLKHDL